MKPQLHGRFDLKIWILLLLAPGTLLSLSCLFASLMLVTTVGCRKSEEPSNQSEFRSFLPLLNAHFALHKNPTNSALTFQIEGFLIAEISAVASKRTVEQLSPQDLQILRVVKDYWSLCPPEPRATPYDEVEWQKAQRFVQSLPPRADEAHIYHDPNRVVVSHGFTPRMLKLACSDSVSRKPITNFTVTLGGPAIFVSLYPSRTNVSEMECRFVRMGPPDSLTRSVLFASTNTAYPLLPVQFTIAASNYVPQTISISTEEMVTSTNLTRKVSLSPK